MFRVIKANVPDQKVIKPIWNIRHSALNREEMSIYATFVDYKISLLNPTYMTYFLAKFLYLFWNKRGRLAIPHMYDDVVLYAKMKWMLSFHTFISDQNLLHCTLNFTYAKYLILVLKFQKEMILLFLCTYNYLCGMLSFEG